MTTEIEMSTAGGQKNISGRERTIRKIEVEKAM
jgi:hypothetical protein